MDINYVRLTGFVLFSVGFAWFHFHERNPFLSLQCAVYAALFGVAALR